MFLDIGAGIIISFLLTNIFGLEINSMIIVLGITFTLLPDIDHVLIFLFRENKIIIKLTSGYRGYTHYPLNYIILSAIIFFLIGPFWSIFFFICTLFHFIHDSFFLGWGIKWFWPFSRISFKFFPDKNGKITSKLLLYWSEKEKGKIMKQYGTKHWIKEFYFRLNIHSFIQYLVFTIGLLVLLNHYF